VLLDSNRVKTDAFRALGARYGADVGEALVRFHIEHGGLSRFMKVRYLHAELLGDDDERAVADDLRRFALLVEEGLRTCAVTDGARELLSALPATTSRFVVSGGLETEVDATLAAHGLRNFFSGVYGSPRTKDEIFANLKEQGHLKDAVFFGDARYDAEVAARFGVDFYFVARYSEWGAGRENCRGAVMETLAVMVPGALAHG
jgi:phosphoglycolate phosphatase-like HAD superfamily hydrolase